MDFNIIELNMKYTVKELSARLDEIEELMEIMNFRSESQDRRIFDNFIYVKRVLEDEDAVLELEDKKGFKKLVERFNLLSVHYDPIEPLN